MVRRFTGKRLFIEKFIRDCALDETAINESTWVYKASNRVDNLKEWSSPFVSVPWYVSIGNENHLFRVNIGRGGLVGLRDSR
jgi:hypothetical protein